MLHRCILPSMKFVCVRISKQLKCFKTCFLVNVLIDNQVIEFHVSSISLSILLVESLTGSQADRSCEKMKNTSIIEIQIELYL